MARSILSTALRLQNTDDALRFGCTLSQEERAELRTVVALMRLVKRHVNLTTETKIAWRMQFIKEAIAFGERQEKMIEPFKTIYAEKFNSSVI